MLAGWLAMWCLSIYLSAPLSAFTVIFTLAVLLHGRVCRADGSLCGDQWDPQNSQHKRGSDPIWPKPNSVRSADPHWYRWGHSSLDQMEPDSAELPVTVQGPVQLSPQSSNIELYWLFLYKHLLRYSKGAKLEYTVSQTHSQSWGPTLIFIAKTCFLYKTKPFYRPHQATSNTTQFKFNSNHFPLTDDELNRKMTTKKWISW